MKKTTTYAHSSFRLVPIACLILILDAGCTTAPHQITKSVENATPASDETSIALQSVQSQLDAQIKRIDRLYEALAPELPEMERRAAELKQQQAEDVTLAMKEVLRQKEDALTDKLVFMPNTPLLAVAQNDGTVRMFSLSPEVGRTTLAGLDSVAKCLAATANGTRLFAGTGNGSVFALEEHGTNFVKIFDWPDWPVTALATSPDGKLVVCACNGKYGPEGKWIQPDESLLAIDVATGKKIWSGKAGRCDFQALSFSGNGKTLAVVQHGSVTLLDPETGRTNQELKHPKYPSGPLSAVMSHDGKLCAVGYAPNDVGIWDVSQGKCRRLLGAHQNWVVALAFSPDDSVLVSSSGDATASVWNVATGRETGRVRFGNGDSYVNSVSISADGRWLAAGRRSEFVVLEMPKNSD